MFVLEGEGEVTELSLELEVAVTLGEENILSDLVNLYEEVNLDKEEVNAYSVTSQNTSIYKGYLYANAVSTKAYETKYTSIAKLEINSLDNIDCFVVREDVDSIKTKDGEVLSLLGLNEYKTTSVSKSVFDEMFDTDGCIEIYSEGQLLGKIDSESLVENESYVYTYETRVSAVEFKLNKVKNEGCLEILNNKVIKKIATFDRAQIKNFSNIETKVEVKEIAKVVKNEIVLFTVNCSLNQITRQLVNF